MKRVLLVLLGALAGTSGLTIVVLVGMTATYRFFPSPTFGPVPTNFGIFFTAFEGYDATVMAAVTWPVSISIRMAPLPYLFLDFLSYSEGEVVASIGAVLGAWSVILWNGSRVLLIRTASAVCSLSGMLYAAWKFNGAFQLYRNFSDRLAQELLLIHVAFCLPLFSWSLALFFFAVLARQRKPLHP